jgi:hypothetical protein
MWIGKQNEELQIEKVCADLLDDSSANNFTLVVPPGFGEAFVPSELKKRLERDRPDIPIAFIKCDSINDKQALFSTVCSQWCPGIDSSGFTSLSQVVKASLGAHPRRVLILSRFHKLLDHVDSSVLVELRDLEQAGDIRTVVCCIYSLSWIKREWRERGHSLLSSDYGDVHTVYPYQLPAEGEIRQRLRSEMPMSLISSIIAWTGGVPEHVDAVAKLWMDLGRPNATSLIDDQLRNAAIEKSDAIARQLDETHESRFLDVVVDLWLPPGNSSAARKLTPHPWANFLIIDTDIASEAIGEACFRIKTQRMLKLTVGNDPIGERLRFAKCAYDRRQFAQAHEISAGLVKLDQSPETVILEQHSAIMNCLVSSGIDVDWSEVHAIVDSAASVVADVVPRPTDRQRLNDRYQDLASLCRTINRVQSDSKGSRRIVDILSKDGSARAATLAILFLAYSNAEATRSCTEAVTKVMALPEQIFRIWAFWKLGLDYDSVPSERSDVWDAASKEWGSIRGGTLTVPVAESPFSGFLVFSFFAVAMIQVRPELREHAPIPSFEALSRKQFVFDWRNDQAHSIAVFSRKNRDKFLAEVKDWLECLCHASAESDLSLPSIQEIFSPLPLLEGERLRWQATVGTY